MTRFSKFILAIATYTFIVTVVSFVINFLSKEESPIQVISSGVTIYGTIITIYILLFHLLIVFVSFIIKTINFRSLTRFSKFILAIATYTFIVTVVSVVIFFLSKEDGSIQAISSGVALYGIIITIYTLLFHLLIVFVSFIIKTIKSQGNE